MATWFPESQTWDHKIELKETFVPKSFKMYNLTPEEQGELDKFLKEILEKGYIQHLSLCTRRNYVGGKHQEGFGTITGE